MHAFIPVSSPLASSSVSEFVHTSATSPLRCPPAAFPIKTARVSMNASIPQESDLSRRDVLKGLTLAGLIGFVGLTTPPAQAEGEAPATATATAETPQVSYNVTGDYKTDATVVLANMKALCALKRGSPDMADTVNATRKQLNDFVALYRRNGKVSGSLSFSNIYTAINTISGHYASYGPNYPIPEKRKQRLEQQFAEIERALSRNR